MTSPSFDVPLGVDGGAALAQFRQALSRPVARRAMGLDLTDDEAACVVADVELSTRWFDFWRTSTDEKSAMADLAEAAAAGRSDIDRTVALPDQVGRTLEWFRVVLRARAATRERIGLDISDEDAAAAADDETLAAAWFKLWRMSRPTPRRISAEQLVDAWQRDLPMRFNRPPGWPMPSYDWILDHIGLEMSDLWRPPGAPTEDPVGWRWWIPQDPAWSAVIVEEKRRYRRGAIWAFGLFGLGVLLISLGRMEQEWAPWAIVAAILSIMFSVQVGAVTIAQYRHFLKDPVGRFRDEHVYRNIASIPNW